jgi:hypothetical protein
MAVQTFRVTTTPRARFTLSVLFFHKDLKFKTLASTKSLDRARKALGLVEPSQEFSTNRRVGDIWKDNATRNVFTVTFDNADFVLETLGKLDKNSDDLLYLADLFEQLDSKKDAEDADTAVPFDEKAEAPKWKAGLHPAVESPALLIDILREYATIQKTQPRGNAADFLMKALKVPEANDNDDNDEEENVVPIETAK